MRNESVDIIIPVYNAYEDLVTCINSIKRWTDLNKHRLVIINDCSTDERMEPYLEKLKNENCMVIHNKTNQGFSSNINLGMAQSEDRDVILLNSDTVVTQNWVEKLLACAYKDAWTATATPLSNNATLCSVPYFCEENELPDGYTVDTYAALIEKSSMKKYPQIPVAHGFCMLIKREVIKLIGDFDAQTFQKGYGEENDFCYRAVEAGYHHAMCDDTFILHTGTSSFEEKEKRKYIQEHEKILDERYPDLMQGVRVHCRDNPTGIISHNIRMRTQLEKCKKRNTVMYLLQADFREGAQDNVGGTQLHVKDLMFGLRDTYNILVAARNFDYLNVTFYAEQKEMFYQFYIGVKPKFERFRSCRFAELYGKILDAFEVDCVHVHHTAGLTMELYYEAKKRMIPVFTTLHDYYCVCPNVKLLDEKHHVCCDSKHHDCRVCLKKQQGIAETIDYIKIWRSQYMSVLKMSEKIIIPSKSAREIICKYYPDLKDRLTIVEHGQKAAKEKNFFNRKKKKFCVAFLGAINEAKGFRLASEMIKKENRDIEWYLFGYFEKQLISLDKKKNFHNIGLYQREELPKLAKRYEIDLICILPIWPETFCYTLSEAILAGVPVLVTDIGAVAERVKEMECGWTVPYQVKCDEVLVKIQSIRRDYKDYKKKWQNVNLIKLRTCEEMCGEYRSIYKQSFISDRTYDWKAENNEWLLNGYLLIDGASSSIVELRNQLKSAEYQINEIYHSFSYRLALMMMKVPIPFRRQIKAVLRNAITKMRKGKTEK